MKKNATLCIYFLMCLHFIAYSQTKIKPIAPFNPVALQHTIHDFGLKGPVKQVDKIFFDKTGRIIENNEDDIQTYTYKANTIEVQKYGFTYIYKLNEKKQIISWNIVGESDFGKFKYDAKGNMEEQTSLSSGLKLRSTYKYDAQNRLIESIEWSDVIPYVTNYRYTGTAENLIISCIINEDPKSESIYYYKKGVLDNSNLMGVVQRKDVVYDKRGNWTGYFDLTKKTYVQRFVDYY